MKLITVLILTFSLNIAFGQNLITNPSAELDPTTNGWTQVSGSWESASWVTPQSGSRHFYAGNGAGSFELYQDVDVSSSSASIDAGTQDFYFACYIRGFHLNNDPGRIIVEYRNASSTVLSTYDTGESATTSWVLFSDTRTAPVSTRTVRIRLISRREYGAHNDGYMDNLQLVAGSPLPIELLNFNVSVKENVRLEWQTASEINNDYFTIERSENGTDWQEIDRLDGAGNSASKQDYFLIDEQPIIGYNYYRLKQTDFDGAFEYSEIISVKINEVSNLQIFPNPTKSQITITENTIELDQIKVYNVFGQDLTRFIEKISNDESKLIIDLSNLNSGFYYIKTKTTANKVYKQ